MTATLAILVGTCLGVNGGAVIASQAPTRSDLDSELAVMRADLAGIRRAQGEAWLTDQRAAEVRALVSDVLADSSTRTQCAESGSTLMSGYAADRGFYLGTTDGEHTARIFGFMQVRFVWNQGYDASERDPSSNSVWGAEVRRAQLFATGNLAGPSLTWLIGVAFGATQDPVDFQSVRVDPASVDDPAPAISYLNVTKHFGSGWYAQVGNIFTPFTYESHLFCTAETQMGECSMLEWLFTAGFTTGVSLGYDGDAIHWQCCYGDQIGTAPSPWNSTSNQTLAFASRVNWKLCGNWEQYAYESSFRGQEFGAFLGAGVRWQNGRADNPAATDGTNPLGFTGDATFMFGGANILVQGVWVDQWASRHEAAWGGLLQGGFFLADSLEAFGNWNIASTDGTQQCATVGMNWYADKRALKVTALVIAPVDGGQPALTSAVLPPQGLGGGSNPNNNMSLSLQIQAAF
ncbi:MAG: hypothetical protein DWH86_02705 [Planctomycetota bacterium]|nr:MAG: hypothetical protein DWH86_02705 [Planctomycetota bacterium]